MENNNLDKFIKDNKLKPENIAGITFYIGDKEGFYLGEEYIKVEHCYDEGGNNKIYIPMKLINKVYNK